MKIVKATNLEKLQSAIDTLGHAANTVYGFSITGSVNENTSIYRFSTDDLDAVITIHEDDTVNVKVTTVEEGKQTPIFEVENRKNFNMVKFISMLMDISTNLKYYHQYISWAENAREKAYQKITDYTYKILEE